MPPLSVDEKQSFASRLLELTTAPQRAAVAGVKTTPIVGYPLFMSWGHWGGIQLNEKGVQKALLLLPYVANGQVALTDIFGESSIESPLKIVASEIVTPVNLKIGITPTLNLSNFVINEYYTFLLALKPAAFIQGGNALAYTDGYILAADSDPKITFKELFNSFHQAKSVWDKLKIQRAQNNHALHYSLPAQSESGSDGDGS
jgi:hypothetical protein